MPRAIKVNGIAILIKPLAAYIFQFFENASILIFLNLHNIMSGIEAKITLTNAKVIGP